MNLSNNFTIVKANEWKFIEKTLLTQCEKTAFGKRWNNVTSPYDAINFYRTSANLDKIEQTAIILNKLKSNEIKQSKFDSFSLGNMVWKQKLFQNA